MLWECKRTNGVTFTDVEEYMMGLSAPKHVREPGMHGLPLLWHPPRDFDYGPSHVSFEQCLHYAAEGRLSILGLVEHLECNGSREYGGCLGQLLFDFIAMKVMNPLIPFNVTTI
jgi:hypothetical protein